MALESPAQAPKGASMSLWPRNAVSLGLSELQEALLALLCDGEWPNPIAPKLLLRKYAHLDYGLLYTTYNASVRLIATTTLSLRYPDGLHLVSAALQELAAEHPAEVHIDGEGRLHIDDWDRLAQRSTELERQIPPSVDADAESRPRKRSRTHTLLRDNLVSASPFLEICPYSTRAACRTAQTFCEKVHFTPIFQPQTDRNLGNCSYLNTCYRPETCRYLHFEVEDPETIQNAQQLRNRRQEWQREQSRLPRNDVGAGAQRAELARLPAQWLDCDVRTLDMTALGKFRVVMADPPWDIHQSLPFGTMNDDEMKALPISDLQDAGDILFLWVTGRALDLGRDCLSLWGYERLDELIWVKTNQLHRIIRTGRTGHWLNHSKEHCLVAYKRPSSGGDIAKQESLAWLNQGFDCDVIVSELRETSRKPNEIYDLIERACPGGRKLGTSVLSPQINEMANCRGAELFGRMHNTHPGWLTLGNQLGSSRIYEKDLVVRLLASGYQKELKLSAAPCTS